MNNKETNPKDALGIKKVPMHSVPCGPLLELGLAMMEGGRKYGSHNYRKVGCRASVYYDAIERHIKAWWEGEDIDPDSGLHHLIKAMACCTVMRDSMLMGNWIDDRPIKYPNGLDINSYNQRAAELIDKYPDAVDPFIERDQKEDDNTLKSPDRSPLRIGQFIIEYVRGFWQIRGPEGYLAYWNDGYKMRSLPFHYTSSTMAEKVTLDYIRSLK